MIKLKPLNGIGRGGEDDCIDGLVMIHSRWYNGTSGGKDDCWFSDDSVVVMIQL